MKRCPRCEFTFADDQQVCDFDQTELISVPHAQRSLKAAALKHQRSHLIRSRAPLALVAIAGVAASALMVGYYDSVNQSNAELSATSPAEPQSASATHRMPTPKSAEAKLDPATKTRFISTQRRIDPRKRGSMPSSMLKWESAAEHSSVFGESPALASTTVKRRTIQTSRDRVSTTVAMRHSAPSQLSRRASHRDNASTFDRSRSKFVAVLKKTGSILSKPFRL